MDAASKLGQGAGHAPVSRAGQNGSSGRSDGGAGNRQTKWRVEERTKKVGPAVDDPPVVVPKKKSKCNEGREVG